MPSPATKPISIALFPAAADRSTLISNSHQQHYLSPPLTPFLHHLSNGDHSKLRNSPPSYFPPSLPSLREMLPHERRPDTVPTESETHVYTSSGQERHSQKDITESLAVNSSSPPHGAQSLPEPNRLLPVYTSQSLNGVSPSTSMLSPLLRRNKAHVASACVNCKKAHLACDGMLPTFSLSLCDYLWVVAFPSQSPVPPPIMAAAMAGCDPRRCGGMWMHVKRQLRTAQCSGYYFILCGLRFWDRGLRRGGGPAIGERDGKLLFLPEVA